VEVLHDNEQWPVLCGPPEQLEHGIEEAKTFVLRRWSALKCRLRFDLGHETGQDRARRLTHPHVAICLPSQEKSAQDLDERSKGQACGPRLEAVTA
jgi:hypothetical protein